MLYFDSEGDAELHFRISDHLATCPTCAEWYAQQQRLEQALGEKLTAGRATSDLWTRVLDRAGVRARPRSRWRWLARAGSLAAAAVIALVIVQFMGLSRSSDLGRLAAGWHEKLVAGTVQPDFQSNSDSEVDRYLKTKVPFQVRCPPRTDVDFAVKGAGVCPVADQEKAAYIMGRVGSAQVSILVLDRSSLDLFPAEKAHLQGGAHHHCREGDYEMVSGVVAGNVVVVIGQASPEALEKLLNAYGTYPEG
jgi:anti-sigma factor RsiW